MGRPEINLEESQVAASPLGSTIRSARRGLGMTVSELAEVSKLGSSRQGYLSKVELGRIRNPSETAIRSIATVLRLDPEQLLSLYSPSPPSIDRIALVDRLQHEIGILRQALENAGIPIPTADSEN